MLGAADSILFAGHPAMTTRERVCAALDGKAPDITPLSIFSWFIDDHTSDRWRRLIEQGLAPTVQCSTVRIIEHGVEDSTQERAEGGIRYRIHTRKTPVGSVQEVFMGTWQREWFVKTPQDYKIMQWISEHTEIAPTNEEYQRAEEYVGDDGVVTIAPPRTPAMRINLEMAGTEQFCIDLGLEGTELFDLYEAEMSNFREITRLVAAGPCRYVDWDENLTARMLGPKWFERLLMPAYQEGAAMLEAAGKRVMCHYDGALSAVAEQIAKSPLHIIESLTEPPEGDMMYDQCRAIWPDKCFWGNINMGLFNLPPEELKEAVKAKRHRAGKRGFAFEISEDLPWNWETAIPVVLEALQELG